MDKPFKAYRQKCVRMLAHRVGVRGRMVEFRPHQSLSPSCRLAVLVSLGLGGLRAPLSDLVVVGKASEHVGIAQRGLRVHVAKPKHRLDPVVYRHSPMRRQNPPYPAVEVFYPVRGRGDRPAFGQPFVEIGEQGSRIAKRHEAFAGLPQPLVPELPAVVGALPQEVLVVGAPSVEACQPRGRLVAVLHAEQLFRYSVQLRSRLGLRTGRRAALDRIEGVEGAALQARRGPLRAHRLLYAAPSVAHQHVGCGYPPHEACPVFGVFASGQVASDHVAVGAGDEYRASPAYPDAVHVDDVMDLVAYGEDGPEPPEPRRLLPEGARGKGELALRELAQQPRDEQLERSRRGVVLAHRRASAPGAAPSLRPGFRGPVSLHPGAADIAFRVCHRPPPQQADFFYWRKLA